MSPSSPAAVRRSVAGFVTCALVFARALTGGAAMSHELTAAARIDEPTALRIVERLPAVVAYARRARGSQWHMVIRTEQQPAPGCDPATRECRWCFYVGETDTTHSNRWETFCVRPDNARVTVIDPVTDEEISYEAFERANRGPPTAPPPQAPGKPQLGK